MRSIPSNALHAALRRAALILAASLLPGWALAQAQSHDHGHDHAGHGTPATATTTEAAPAAQGQELSEGEVTRWDARTNKLTLRHGELRNLGMPPMTMVFQLRLPSAAPALKPGDKVRFRAEQDKGSLVVTALEVQG